MKRTILLLAVTLLAACGEAEDTVAPESVVATPAPIQPGEILSGEQAYQRVCARCHDDGIDGAPRIGDTEAWATRSALWEANLFEHARSGYGDMPAKGGEASLDDHIVTKAAEYILTQTFPDAHPSN